MPLTAAELVRSKRVIEENNDQPGQQQPSVDLDEEIRRLEAELAESLSSSDSSSDESDESVEGDDNSDHRVLNLSKFKHDKIEGLSHRHLPSNSKRTMKIDREGGATQRPPKKKKTEMATSKEPSGLEAAVKQVLDGYVPRSSEKIPFYCRYCAKQMSNEQEWRDHQETEFHKTAVSVERKRTYCKLCRKQLTSIVQMEEHLKSRPHRQHLERVKSRQLGSGRRGRGHGHGGNRQWT